MAVKSQKKCFKLLKKNLYLWTPKSIPNEIDESIVDLNEIDAASEPTRMTIG